MTKRTIKETVTEYDEAGKITRQTTTETTEDNDTNYSPYAPTYPPSRFWYQDGPTCSDRNNSGGNQIPPAYLG